MHLDRRAGVAAPGHADAHSGGCAHDGARRAEDVTGLKRIRFPALSIRLVTIVLGLGALAVVVAFVVAIRAAAQSRDRTNQRVHVEVALIEAMQDARIASVSQGVDLTSYFIGRDELHAIEFESQGEAVTAAFDRARAIAGDGDAGELEKVEQLARDQETLEQAERQILDALRRDDVAGAFSLIQETNIAVTGAELADSLAEFAAHGYEELASAQAADKRAQSRMMAFVYGIGGLCLVVGLAFIVAAFRWIVRPLEEVSRASRAIAHGELEVRVPETGPRELVGLGYDVNRMAEALIRRSEELNAYLSKNLEERTAQLEDSNSALERSEARFRSLVQNTSDLIAVINPDTTLLYESPATEGILGRDPDSLRDTRLSELIHPDDLTAFVAFTRSLMAGTPPPAAEARFRHKDGSWRHLEIVGSDQRHNPAIGGLVFNMRDTTERKALEEELRHQAFHDRLTGLANRASFSDRLEHALSRGIRTGSSLSVLFLDLDKFKSVNDRLGHPAGDRLLEQTAHRLLRCVRAGDTVARFGGDEFAILLEDLTSVETAVETANRVLRALREPLQIDGTEVSPRASIGIAFADSRSTSADLLLRNADVALYVAKDRGRDRLEIYDEGMHASMIERLELLSELEGAVERGEFRVFYQPTICLRNRRMVGAEALVRWEHPKKGRLRPDEFIPLAEESGAILELGHWVLVEACKQVLAWQTIWNGEEPFSMSVNVSVRQLTQPSFVDEVRDVLVETGVDPSCLVLEVTESVMMRDTGQMAAVLQNLKTLGVKLAIDDFGTGYSSLSYLRQLPFDILKIDKSFVGGEQSREHDEELEKLIVELGKTLHLEIVAEGIEREDQLTRLQDLTCELGQGYLFAEPMPAWEMEALIEEDSPAHRAA